LATTDNSLYSGMLGLFSVRNHGWALSVRLADIISEWSLIWPVSSWCAGIRVRVNFEEVSQVCATELGCDRAPVRVVPLSPRVCRWSANSLGRVLNRNFDTRRQILPLWRSTGSCRHFGASSISMWLGWADSSWINGCWSSKTENHLRGVWNLGVFHPWV